MDPSVTAEVARSFKERRQPVFTRTHYQRQPGASAITRGVV